jgi:hypothetical protein
MSRYNGVLIFLLKTLRAKLRDKRREKNSKITAMQPFHFNVSSVHYNIVVVFGDFQITKHSVHRKIV